MPRDLENHDSLYSTNNTNNTNSNLDFNLFESNETIGLIEIEKEENISYFDELVDKSFYKF